MLGRASAVGVAAIVLAGGTLSGCGGGSSTKDQVAASGAPVIERNLAKRHVAPSPTLIRLRAELRKALRKSGRDSGLAVYDLTTRQTLFEWGGEVRRPPASVEKIYTTIALERKLGLSGRLRTSVLGTGHLDQAGVWHGDLYLRGGGDPTFGDGTFNRIWEYGYGPTASELARDLRAAGIIRVTGRLIGDESLFDTRRGGPQTGYAPDLPDFGGQLTALAFDHGASALHFTPATFAAKQMAATLRAQHMRVTAATVPGVAPRHAHRLASVVSPPMSVLLKLMDVPSDDLFAELLTKQLGVRFRHHGSISAGARVISKVIASYHVHPTIVDGSGLSRDDRSSPVEIVDLLRGVWHTSEGRGLARALPTVGVNGTVRRIAVGTTAQGRCIAKTGTLNYVTNLAGYCASRGHQMVAFSFFIDGPSNERALLLLGQMVNAVAKY